MLGYALLLPEELDDDDGVKLVPCIQCDVNMNADDPVLGVMEEDANVDVQAPNALKSANEIPDRQPGFDQRIDQTETHPPEFIANDNEVVNIRAKTNSEGNHSTVERKLHVDREVDSCDKELSRTAKYDKTYDYDKTLKEYRKPGGKYDMFVDYVEKSGPGSLKCRNLRKVQCLLCGDGRIYSYGNIRRHIDSLHSNRPPIVCEICNSKFSQKRCLADHRKNVHKIVNSSNNRKEKTKNDRHEYQVPSTVPAPSINPTVNKKYVNSESPYYKSVKNSQRTLIKPYSRTSKTHHADLSKAKRTTTKPAVVGSKEVNHNREVIQKTQPDHPMVLSGITQSLKSAVTQSPNTVVNHLVDSVVRQSSSTVVTKSPSSVVAQEPSSVVTQSFSSVVAQSPSPVVIQSPRPVVTQLTSTVMVTHSSSPVRTHTQSPGTVVTLNPTDTIVTLTPAGSVVTTTTLVSTPSSIVTPSGATVLVTPTEENSAKVTGTDNLVPVTIISSSKGRLKLGLPKDVKFKKAMSKFGKRYGVDYKQLRFVIEGTGEELTGKETVGNMRESNVMVYGD